MFKKIALIEEKANSETLQTLFDAVNKSATSVERTFSALQVYSGNRVVEVDIAKKQAQLGVLSVGCAAIADKAIEIHNKGLDLDRDSYVKMMSVLSDINAFCSLVKKSCCSWGAKD